jgi:ATP-dependent RNA helicase DDX27
LSTLDKIIENKRKEMPEASLSKKAKKRALKEDADGKEDAEVILSEKKEDTPQERFSFHELSLGRPIQKALTAMHFVRPTAIQASAIPIALTGRDILGGATTGSGKTAAFFVPILERLLYRSRNVAVTRVLVLLPTRELAVQCLEVGQKLAHFTDIQMCLLAGGLPIKPQEQALRRRPDVIVATPGRLLDLLKNSASFNLDSIEILVLDEADRILEIGFKDEIDAILEMCPKHRQTMLFSATMSPDIAGLVNLSLNKPIKVMVDSNEAIAANLTQEFVRIRAGRESDREPIVLALCAHYFPRRTIVFFQTKADAHRMKVLFGLHGMKAAELHGNLSQTERLQALESFKGGAADFLLATDVAARGLDISGVQTVVNYSVPLTFAQYQHRIGRTARAGKSGRSISLITEADRKLLKLAIKNSRDSVKQRSVPSEMIASYARSIAAMESKILEIIDEEAQARELARAELELKRVENIMHHADEIYSRPKRIWIEKKGSAKGLKVRKQRGGTKDDEI